jgi:hypothetical protein
MNFQNLGFGDALTAMFSSWGCHPAAQVLKNVTLPTLSVISL